ncbi:pyrimidine 5'-nucleotidase [Denitratisoma sp. DHT3]|uniref:pyrimidine 5'-nucleotidase n=1 Tax=Denitratisoma sp. DHT3 TaxID=1981880 RepID=UPI0011985F9A|nr:pyrimidine 5'-nucleotidase [Denitratisoma sp. DHT3]QDX82402.1 pyrimidine 5'-nucleotidase [Denitratisoma sp. DHT3]
MNQGGRVWLFDLDNTLHDATPHIFPHINRAMTTYVAGTLDLPEDEASRLRVDYWQRYGATLSGMMRHHDTNPHHFLWHTHQFPDLGRMVVFRRALGAALDALPGRKIVFSNAPAHYAAAVLDIMGVHRHFDAIWSIERLRFTPKPFRAGFQRLLQQEGLRPAQCVMVEDSAENLRTAKRLGMTTVLISRRLRTPAFVDVRLDSVLHLPRRFGRR